MRAQRADHRRGVARHADRFTQRLGFRRGLRRVFTFEPVTKLVKKVQGAGAIADAHELVERLSHRHFVVGRQGKRLPDPTGRRFWFSYHSSFRHDPHRATGERTQSTSFVGHPFVERNASSGHEEPVEKVAAIQLGGRS